MEERWAGAFDSAAYDAARKILELDRERAAGEVKAMLARRGRIVAAVAIVWAICSVAMTLANHELLLVAEIGWIALVAWAVFFLLPPVMGRGNLEELFGQYAQRLDELEAAEAALPAPACMEDLAAALDLVKLPGEPSEG